MPKIPDPIMFATTMAVPLVSVNSRRRERPTVESRESTVCRALEGNSIVGKQKQGTGYFFGTNVDRGTVLVVLLNHNSTVTRSGATTENPELVTES